MSVGRSRDEKRSEAEATALGLALRDALCDLVQVHGLTYLDTFLERRLRHSVEELRRDTGVNVPGILAAVRSTADEAEAALRREIDFVRNNPTPVR